MYLLSLLLLTACRTKDQGVDTVFLDHDGDGLSSDEDCDDSDPEVGGPSDWYADQDGDGFGAGEATSACDPPSGTVGNDEDCEDSDAAIYPGAPEEDCTDPVDYNCDGSVGYADEDEDGWAACQDCDDSKPDVNPDQIELCNGRDDDCDNTIDEPDAQDALTWYADQDDDGFGDPDNSTPACEQPSGYVEDATDCQDGDGTVFPGAEELCDGQLNDCDGQIADGEQDDDGDHYVECIIDDGGWDGDSSILGGEDCDDEDATVHPDAEELCDGLDNDCDEQLSDEEKDDDGDLYVECTITSWLGDATILGGEDCNDEDKEVHPGADELCSTAYDDDCDGTANEDDAVDASTWYADTDGDDYGDPDSTTTACEEPSGYADNDEDCDDSTKLISPAESESCNGINDDCDANIDETVLGTGSACPAGSCSDILADGTTTDGSYTLEDSTGTTYSAYCDQNTDNGGWTLVGSVVNEINTTGSHDRNWDSYSVWTDDSTVGTISDRQSGDYKGEAWVQVDGDDVLIVTNDYGFAFYNLVGSQPYGDHIAAEYTSSCNETLLASGADYYDTLSATQAAALVYIIRPKDTNAQCFPTSNENAILGLQLNSCCWAGGLGNTPAGYPTWDIYDNSLLELSRITPGSCTAGNYPCNDNGYYTSGFTYTYDSKVTWAEIYVR